MSAAAIAFRCSTSWTTPTRSRMCNNTMLDGSVNPKEQDSAEAERNKLSPYRAFWSITLGSAEALYIDDKLGNFNPGKEADLVVLDWNGGPRATPLHQSMVAE